MRRILILALNFILSLSLFAYDFQIGDLCYSITSITERTVSVEASSTSLNGDVVIPSVVNYNDVDFTVTYIASNGFAYCHNITSFTIPNTVMGIGYEGFGWCWYLKTIILDNPRSSFSVGSDAFDYDWRAFKTVRIINIDEKELLNNGAGLLSSYSLPTHDLYINDNKVIDYEVADGVETINNCFRNCNSIETLSMPNSVRTIVSSACYSCTALKTITLSSKLESIGYNAFAECPELRTIYAKSAVPPSIDASTFPNGAYMFATLYVPKGKLSAYKNANIWSNFANIIETEYEDGPDIPQPKKCEKPNISYVNGQLKFASATDGVEFVSEITDSDIKKNYEATVSLTATYNISVYATKSGYENSETATATLCWIDASPKTEGITNGVAQIAARPVLVKTDNGFITVEGVDERTNVSVYTTDGKQVGSAISQNNTATIATSIQPGSIAIIKVGERSVKVVVK